MSRTASAVGIGVVLLSGCVYFNTLYDAQNAWSRGERARLTGDPETAREAWEEAAQKAGRAFRKDSIGRWSDTALLTLGRSWLRLGRWPEARGALQEVLRRSEDPRTRREAQVFLGAVDAIAGSEATALQRLDRALGDDLDPRVRAEGHLWRARLNLRLDRPDLGWWDLDRAAEYDPRLIIPAHLERVRWGVASGDLFRARAGANALLRDPVGAVWTDSLAELVRGAARHSAFGASEAAVLLVEARAGPWAPEVRNPLLFLRAELLMEAGDTLAAETELGAVAAGVGGDAVEARLILAKIRLHAALTPIDLEGVRRVLLPAVGDPRVLGRLQEIRILELLNVWGVQGDPAAYFAAAEFARDRLESPGLARALLRSMVEADPNGPWTGKALLAALALTGHPSERAELIERIDRRSVDPYVLAHRNGYLHGNRLEVSEAELSARTSALLQLATEEARRRDVEIRLRSGGQEPA